MKEYLLSRAREPADGRTALCLDVLQGLHALHACDIVHGDIKLENMLVFKGPEGHPQAKVADFGSAIVLNDADGDLTYLGTPLYNPPEVRALEDRQLGAYVEKDQALACDVYAFGLLVWETCLDASRYLGRHLTEEILKGRLVDLRRMAIRRAKQRITHLKAETSTAIILCLQMCLAPKPCDRRPLAEVQDAVENLRDGLETT
jgi:serine/threonine protein kinase